MRTVPSTPRRRFDIFAAVSATLLRKCSTGTTMRKLLLTTAQSVRSDKCRSGPGSLRPNRYPGVSFKTGGPVQRSIVKTLTSCRPNHHGTALDFLGKEGAAMRAWVLAILLLSVG